MMTFQQVIATYVLRMLSPFALPDIATSALESGRDSPTLRVLAGEPADGRDFAMLFERAVKELGFQLPDPLDAARMLRRHYASEVAEGRLPPSEGARLIVEGVHREIDHLLTPGKYVGDSFGIARLVGLHYSYDDVDPADTASIASIDQAIVEECQRLSSAAFDE